MMFIVDATYLTHVATIDAEIFRKVRVASIGRAMDEATYNLDDEVQKTKMRKYVETIAHSKAAKEKEDFKNLSATDRELLQTCMDRKNECALVTDDGLLATAASRENVKVYSTPGFIETSVKNKRIEKNDALDFLDALLRQYPRKKAIENAIQRIKEF